MMWVALGDEPGVELQDLLVAIIWVGCRETGTTSVNYCCQCQF